eukprot:TRINITY_DN7978_c0_g1_i1.p1 TRINITY_DN7978_c0_g1~~TRINITY_DN7978_c0_g1_i1.p1  ORF type:complete len:198 (+),score=26.61 TRINITY_DN7978_c0_g1_i1:66-659(+)
MDLESSSDEIEVIGIKDLWSNSSTIHIISSAEGQEYNSAYQFILTLLRMDIFPPPSFHENMFELLRNAKNKDIAEALYSLLIQIHMIVSPQDSTLIWRPPLMSGNEYLDIIKSLHIYRKKRCDQKGKNNILLLKYINQLLREDYNINKDDYYMNKIVGGSTTLVKQIIEYGTECLSSPSDGVKSSVMEFLRIVCSLF